MLNGRIVDIPNRVCAAVQLCKLPIIIMHVWTESDDDTYTRTTRSHPTPCPIVLPPYALHGLLCKYLPYLPKLLFYLPVLYL